VNEPNVALTPLDFTDEIQYIELKQCSHKRSQCFHVHNYYLVRQKHAHQTDKAVVAF